MPYYIFTVTGSETTGKTATLVSEYDTFKAAKTEVKRLRREQPLPDDRVYRINFSPSEAAAEKALTEIREEPIAKEWEK